MNPKIQYATSKEINIAYQVFGSGPIDLVYIPGWVSNIAWMWACPELVSFFKELGKIARVILFDKRGTGLSDRVVEFATLEERMDDIKAVMDAVGSKKAVLFGHSEGGSVSALFSATYPNRVSALMTFGIFAKREYCENYPWAPTQQERQKVYDMIEHNWGSVDMDLETLVPSKANDKQFMTWLASYFRFGASPKAAMTLTKMNTQVNIIDILKYIKVPTLLMQRTNDIDVKVEEGRFISEHIKDSKFFELAGNDHLFWVGNTKAVLDEINTFIKTLPKENQTNKGMCTVLFGDINSGSRGNLKNEMIHEYVNECGGYLVQSDKKQFLAKFEVPGKAVSCSLEMLATLRDAKTSISMGIFLTDNSGTSDEVLNKRDEYIMQSIRSQLNHNQIFVRQEIKHLLTGASFNFSEAASMLAYTSFNTYKLYNVNSFLGGAKGKQKQKHPSSLSHYNSFLEDVLQIIEHHIDNSMFGVDMLTRKMGVNERKLQRKIKETTGKSPSQLITAIRLDKAKSALNLRNYTIAEIAFQFGFSSPSYFSRCFKKEFGFSPNKFYSNS